MGKGALDDRSLLSLPAVGLQARDSMTAGLDEADVVICVGYDVVEFGPAGWNPKMLKRIIHVDARPAEVDQSYIPEVEIVAGVRETLQALRAELPAAPEPAYVARLRVAVNTELRASAERPGVVSPQAAISAIRGAMAPTDILVSDVGAHKLWLGRLFPAYEPNTVIVGNGFASMGIALPGAIAATLAMPERRVVAVSGRRRLPDERAGDGDRDAPGRAGDGRGVGGRCLRGHRLEAGAASFGRTHAIHFGNPDFADLARAFGWSHRNATDGASLSDALGAAFAEKGPALITVPIDYRHNARLANLGEPALSA